MTLWGASFCLLPVWEVMPFQMKSMLQRNLISIYLLGWMGIFSLSAFSATNVAGTDGEVVVLTVENIINPVTAEYIIQGIKQASKEKAAAVVIQLDTPGGLVTSTRTIIKEMLNSPVPVVVYVAPSGSQAASAGTFIMIAANIAAMAPGTNMGAAHPVSVGGEKMDKTMSDKVENDLAAYIRSLAEKRGRNAKWAEKAVRKSVSASEKEALKLKVIDLIARNLDELLKAIDGKEVEIVDEKILLHTQNKPVRHIEMSLRQQVLSFASNPTVAYFLLMLGFYGLIFELSSPGAILPGVVGGISLLLGLYAFQMLPVNYAGLLLILLAIIMFLAEIKVPSHGALTIGGVISMVLGSLMLIDSPAPYLIISLQVILSMTLATVVFFLFLVRAVFLVHRVTPATGAEWLLSAIGTVRSWEEGSGKVFIQGELWNAQGDGPLQEGEEVKVVEVDGLKLRVKSKKEG